MRKSSTLPLCKKITKVDEGNRGKKKEKKTSVTPLTSMSNRAKRIPCNGLRQNFHKIFTSVDRRPYEC